AVLVSRWCDRGEEWELRNPAVNGYTTDDLILDELYLVEAFKPDLVTVLIGANDVVAALGECGAVTERVADRYRQQLRRIHEQMRRGMTAPDGLHPSAEAYAEWADALKDALR